MVARYVVAAVTLMLGGAACYAPPDTASEGPVGEVSEALVVWHCVAHPPGVDVDQHDGFGLSMEEAGQNALADCQAEHGNCVVEWGLCHVDHD
jgi:hypothetical protein